jgi:hypothetical protein
MTITDDETAEILRVLGHIAAGERVSMLQILADDPTGSPQILDAVQRLLNDSTIALLSIPYVVGEVRWAAAHALRAERRARGRTDPVILTDVPTPVNVATLGALARSANLPILPGAEGLVETFGVLRDRRLLPTSSLRLQR